MADAFVNLSIEEAGLLPECLGHPAVVLLLVKVLELPLQVCSERPHDQLDHHISPEPSPWLRECRLHL